jgi:hypothetical protein
VKSLHRTDLFQWSRFDEARNIDFHALLWVRPGGNVVFDPLPLSEHDRAHLKELGGAAWVVVTNGDHLRDTVEVVKLTEARIAAPAGERGKIPIPVDRWLGDGESLVPGLVAYACNGSKTPGELAFHLAPDTLITGDLVRGQRANALNLLPAAKLTDVDAAKRSVARLAAIPGITTVLVGDGWPLFHGASEQLARLSSG